MQCGQCNEWASCKFIVFDAYDTQVDPEFCFSKLQICERMMFMMFVMSDGALMVCVLQAAIVDPRMQSAWSF